MPWPAVLALLLSYAVAGQRHAAYANTIAAGGADPCAHLCHVLKSAGLYHGPVLTRGPTTGAEQYSYSIAWLIFGVVLLGIGILLSSQRARLASAAVIALTIAKAFLIDMSTLSGIFSRRCRSSASAWCWWRSAGFTSASCSADRRRRRQAARTAQASP